MEFLKLILDHVPGSSLGDKLQVLAIAGAILGALYGLLRRWRRTDVASRVETIGSKIEEWDTKFDARLKALEAKLTGQAQAKRAELSDGAAPAQGDKGLIQDLNAAIATLAGEGKTAALSALEMGDRSAADNALAAKIEEIEGARGIAAKEEAALYRQRGALAFLDNTVEALRHYATATDVDPSNADGWNKLGNLQLRIGDLDAATRSFERVLALGNQSDDPTAVSIATGNLGLVYQMRGDLDRAEAMHRKALAIEKSLGRKEGMASDYGNLGLIYLQRGDLDRAEEMHKMALAIDEVLGSKGGMASGYGNLGIVYQTRGDLDRAEEMHKKAVAIDEALGRKSDTASDYGNLGIVYQMRGDFDQAEVMYRRALAIDEALGRKEAMASNYGNLGNVYGARGDIDQAEAMYVKALRVNEAIGSKMGVASDRSNLGLVYQRRGDVDQACVSWRQALELYNKIGARRQADQIEEWMRDAGCPGH